MVQKSSILLLQKLAFPVYTLACQLDQKGVK